MLKKKIGAIAQLGERVNGIHEVSGSIPLSSTILLQKVISCGAIAQLGERVNGIHEVSGSIPLSSTISPENKVQFS